MNGLSSRNRKALAAQLYETLNRYEFVTAATMVTQPESYLTTWLDVRQTFPDMRLEPLDSIADDTWIAVFSVFHGTHHGTATLPHHGTSLVGAKPTGKTVSVQQVSVYQAVAGKLSECYTLCDTLSLYQQLGFAPDFMGETLSKPCTSHKFVT